MLNEHIKKLKLMTSQRQIDFSQVFNYFLTHIGENKKFNNYFKAIDHHKILEPGLVQLAQSVYGNNISISKIFLFRLETENFLHGTVQLSNNIFWCLYFFEDILSGIVCNFASLTQRRTDYYRLEMFTSDKPLSTALSNQIGSKADIVYDQIGMTYDLTRRADPVIVEHIFEELSPKPKGTYLDIACGSGNYTCALANKGLAITGIDISTEMLAKAKNKNSLIDWIHGDASKLPFKKESFNGAVCTLATHHIENLDAALLEIYRVMEQGNFVIFTSTPEQMRNYWLWHYFPNMMRDSTQQMLELADLQDKLIKVGFNNVVVKPYFVDNNLLDWFAAAGKYRPEIYLDPNVRAGISAFAKFCRKDEEEAGIIKLKQDINSGKIKDIITSYESDKGDYLFISASK